MEKISHIPEQVVETIPSIPGKIVDAIPESITHLPEKIVDAIPFIGKKGKK